MNCQSNFSLNSLPTGKKADVIALRGGREFQHRILSLGLSIGCEVEMMQNHGGAETQEPIAIRVGDTRLMLGHGMARKIFVRAKAAD